METFEAFEQQLREALTHLYDPSYRPEALFWQVMGREPSEGIEVVQAAIIRAIEALKPPENVPEGARVTRIYDLLSCRYLKKLTQEETAKRLGITTRHARREQREAVKALAWRLWEQASAADRAPSGREEAARQAPETASDWRSQVRAELASLQQSAPGTVSNVGVVIQGIVKLGPALPGSERVQLKVSSIPADLTVSLHPSVLRQILITAIEKLTPFITAGEITLGAERIGKRVEITFSGYPVTADNRPSSDFIQEILAAQGGTITIRLAEERLFIQLTVPAVDEVKVLVVDDNTDLVHFYRRYTTGTRYRILHVSQGEDAFEAIEESPPDILVLDVMLPDIDGWELLARLREHPATRITPIIVCSVVRREELALALGAALYVPKPVRRREFIQALDRVLNQVSTEAPPT